jgi:hypothetical protein
MTDQVGVVTGELVLRTEATADGRVELRVQYVSADEWYTVTGGRYRLRDPAGAAQVHQAAVALLAKGGQDAASLTAAGQDLRVEDQ